MIFDLLSPPNERSGWPWTESSPPIPPAMPDGSPWPKISIVTPSLNQAQYIEETIRSVLLQGYPNLEYIIIDGGSTDGSVEIIKKYEPWLTYWVSESDRGQTHAINKGIQHCQGEIFAFINSDDLYYPNTFQAIAKLFHQNGLKSDTWIGGQIHLVDEAGQVLSTRKNYYGSEPLDWYLHRWTKHGTTFSQPSSFWSMAIFNQTGDFDESFNYSFDYEFFVRMYSLGIKWIDSDGIYAGFRVHPCSKTIVANTSFVEEDYKIAKKYWPLNRNISYWKLLKKAELQIDKKKLTRLLLEEKTFWILLRNILPLLQRHPQFVFLRRTLRGLLKAGFSITIK